MTAVPPGSGSMDPVDHPPRPFPEDDWQWFVERCQALGIPDPQGRRSTLEALYGHLAGVNSWCNLTRLSDARAYLARHVLDALTVCAGSGALAPDGRQPALDIGSGGGYPGLPLALWVPGSRWTLIDNRRRKADFLNAAAGLIGARVSARHLRAAEAPARCPDLRRSQGWICARAVADASLLLREAAGLLAPGGLLVLYKGPSYLGEEAARCREAAARLGYVAAGLERVTADPADGERLLAGFRRL